MENKQPIQTDTSSSRISSNEEAKTARTSDSSSASLLTNPVEAVTQKVDTVTGSVSNLKEQTTGIMASSDLNGADKAVAVALVAVDTFQEVKAVVDSVVKVVDNIGGLADKAFISVMGKLTFLRGLACLDAVKQTDPVMGIDLHAVLNPVPMLPHIYIGIMFNPKDFISAALCQVVAISANYVPTSAAPVTVQSGRDEIMEAAAAKAFQFARGKARSMGASVLIGQFLPRVIVTTPSQPIPHIPMGAGFTNLGVKKTCGHAFLGSLFVNADGNPMSGGYLHLHNDCWDFGLPPVATLIEKAAKKLFKHGEPAPPKEPPKDPRIELYCPTGIMMPIPWTKPVLVNPIPTPINPTAAVKIFVKAGFQKLGEIIICKIENLLKGTKLGDKLGGCDFWTEVSRRFGTGTSHPADVAKGYFYTGTTDFSISGIIPLSFKRTYNSYSEYRGPLGTGWHHSYDMALAFDWEAGFAGIRLKDGRTAGFEIPAAGKNYFNRKERMWFHHHADGHFFITDKKGYVYRFTDKEYKSPYNTSSAHLIQSISNRNGYSLRFAYHTDGILSHITDTAGRVFDVKNDGKGHITQIISPSPESGGEPFVIAAYEYDPQGRMVKQTNALGHSMHFEYNGSLMVKETWRNGLNWHITYDKNGKDAKCLEIKGDGGLFHHKLEYISHDCTKVTNSLGNVTLYYHRNGVVIKRIDPNGAEHSFRYNDNCELIWTKDPLGGTTSSTYDDWGNLINRTSKDGAFIQINYENCQFPFLPTSAVDSVGGRWVWEHDKQGNMIKRTDPMHTSINFKFTDGLLKAIVGAKGEQTKLKYDRHNNLIEAIAPDGGKRLWSFNELSQCIQRKNVNEGIYKYEYNLLGQTINIKQPDGNIRKLKYDEEGNIIHAKDNDRDVKFTYKGVNRMASRSERGATLKFIYDTEDQLRSVINENGEQYRFEFDKQGNIIEETGFDGLTRNYIRDIAGRIIQLKRSNENIISYEYDVVGRVVQVIYTCNKKEISQETYTYRKDGKLIKAVNPDAEVILERDLLGRVIKESCNGETINSTYDLSGNRTRITSTLGANIEAEYNLMGDVMSLSTGNWQVDYERDLFGLETHRSLTGDIEIFTERDPLGRVTTHKTGHNQQILSEKNYLWGTNDKLLSIIDGGQVTSFEYDGWGNLSKTIFADGKTELRNPDKSGNLFESLNRMDRQYAKGGQLIKTERWEYKYDKEGNLIRKRDKHGATWRYEWNVSGMLEKVKRPDGAEVSFKYDALGRRIEKKFRSRITRWIWDGNIPLHEQRETLTRDYSEEKGYFENSEKEPVITWLFDEGTFVPAAKLTENKNLSIVTNYLGTPEAMYDETGQTTWSCQLNSYGKVQIFTGQYKTDCPFRYQGQYEDAETGLYYNRFRYYSPDEGIYLSQDPISLNGSVCLYSYVMNPHNWVDPLGLMPWKNPVQSGHHLVYEQKAKSIGLDHLASDSTPRYYFNDPYVPGSHERVHAAQRPYVGPRQGPWEGTADELIAASKKGLGDVDDISGYLMVKSTGEVLAENVTPAEAFEILEEWHNEQMKEKEKKESENENETTNEC